MENKWEEEEGEEEEENKRRDEERVEDKKGMKEMALVDPPCGWLVWLGGWLAGCFSESKGREGKGPNKIKKIGRMRKTRRQE